MHARLADVSAPTVARVLMRLGVLALRSFEADFERIGHCIHLVLSDRLDIISTLSMGKIVKFAL